MPSSLASTSLPKSGRAFAVTSDADTDEQAAQLLGDLADRIAEDWLLTDVKVVTRPVTVRTIDTLTTAIQRLYPTGKCRTISPPRTAHMNARAKEIVLAVNSHLDGRPYGGPVGDAVEAFINAYRPPGSRSEPAADLAEVARDCVEMGAS